VSAASVVIGGAMLKLSSIDAVVARIARANEVVAQAYTLHGPVLRALETAARRGARVVVELERQPFDDPNGGLARENRRVASQLRSAGAEARLGDPIHAKTIEVDGTLYLDEKNWGRHDVVVREAGSGGAIPMTKRQALAAEAKLLDGAGARDGVVVESESFGCCNPVYGALAALGLAGAAPRLLVSERDLRNNARERGALARLARCGVRVRVCSDSAKLAAAGDHAWLGSANATYAGGRWNMTDWGASTGDAAIVRSVRTRLEAQWKAAKAFG
jgi:phosphatidylserine/phosphatidylglycerophosphate/cardiolipin synthase-like enzyme